MPHQRNHVYCSQARLSVGLQGLAGASAAYNNAVAYAKDRIQGRAVEKLLVGDGLKTKANQGPLIDLAALKKVEQHISDAYVAVFQQAG